MLKVDEETVRRWIRQKKLKAHLVGARYRIERRELESFISHQNK
ncbi:MAG: helix-turn-helix domain-containing protein [Candidatus Desulforudis sp.]|nr:helix-turn-helix domain-containing protein [Desulforudis sp.]